MVLYNIVFLSMSLYTINTANILYANALENQEKAKRELRQEEVRIQNERLDLSLPKPESNGVMIYDQIK